MRDPREGALMRVHLVPSQCSSSATPGVKLYPTAQALVGLMSFTPFSWPTEPVMIGGWGTGNAVQAFPSQWAAKALPFEEQPTSTGVLHPTAQASAEDAADTAIRSPGGVAAPAGTAKPPMPAVTASEIRIHRANRAW